MSDFLLRGGGLDCLSYKTLFRLAEDSGAEVRLGGRQFFVKQELKFGKKLDLLAAGPGDSLYVADRHGDLFRVGDGQEPRLAGANLGMPRFMLRLASLGREYLALGDHCQRVKMFDFDNLHNLRFVNFYHSQPLSLAQLPDGEALLYSGKLAELKGL